MAKKNSRKSQPRKREIQPRAKRGKVSVTSRDGRLQINIPAQYSPTGKQYHRALKLADIPDNRSKAQRIVNQINSHISDFEDYDPQKLDEYIFGKVASIESSTNSNPSSRRKLEPTLDELWEKFAIESLRLKKIDESTYEELYTRIGKILRGLSTQSLRDAKDIFATIQSKYAEISCYYILGRLSACCEWAVDEGKIEKNPFKKLVEGLPVPKFEFNPDPFSEEEIERILAAFAAYPEYMRYVLYIIFKLETGCRPAEAAGLRWRNVDLIRGVITFCETITFIRGKYIAKKGTKTVPTRSFPISPYLKEILEQIRPTQVNPDDFVFAEPNGKHFDTNKFYRVWHTSGGSKRPGIVSHLAQIPWEEGGIKRYRSPYKTRHTYITLTLEQMARDNKLTPSNIALLADSLGNSVGTINKSYLGRSQDQSVLYNPIGQRKMSANSPAQEAQPEDQVANSHSLASLSSLEEPKDQALQQENNELPSALQSSPPSAPVEDPLEPASLPEADLAEMASLLTLVDEEFQQTQDE